MYNEIIKQVVADKDILRRVKKYHFLLHSKCNFLFIVVDYEQKKIHFVRLTLTDVLLVSVTFQLQCFFGSKVRDF